MSESGHCKILCVDDDVQSLKSMEFILKSANFSNLILCDDPVKAKDVIFEQDIELVLLDLIMPVISGNEMLNFIKEHRPDTQVIIITGNSDLDTAIKCIKDGADDYVTKPVEKNRLLASVKKSMENIDLKRENQKLRECFFADKFENEEFFSEIISNSKIMYSIFHYIEAVAESPGPVLVTGETGVGKELIARAIHKASKRKGGFVAVNAAGLDDNLFSDSLFGHVDGAFTDARGYRKGLIEQAHDGTLFLDEIGDLSMMSQVKLLRLLQEDEYFPLGSDMAKKSDARIIVATNKDLSSLYRSKEFRKDLYFRLKTHNIRIPPLRKRLEDLPLLVDHFIKKAATVLNKKIPTYPKELLTLLSTWPFEGNIRELESMIFDAISKHKNKILSLESFRFFMEKDGIDNQGTEIKSTTTANKLDFGENLPTINEVTHLLIEEAMERSKGNQSVASSLLGISQQALSRRLKNQRD
ncbi:MAG: sigma-54-dependent Fis family transcriptional regulator [Bacteriovoracaceae bacterium]|nr:sigma-54-dependent Fis family transcriptional regulator [Bacteriovoracaceae bacterium]